MSGAPFGVARDILAIEARLAALEASRSVQPAPETAAAGANDPGRDNEPKASDGPGDGWRLLHAPYDSPRLGDERMDCMSNPKGPWVPLSVSDVGRWLPWAEYRRRIEPVDPIEAAGERLRKLFSKDAATEGTSQAVTADSLPDDAGRRLVAGEPMTAAEMQHALGVARQEIARLTAERDAALREVKRLTAERDAALARVKELEAHGRQPETTTEKPGQPWQQVKWEQMVGIICGNGDLGRDNEFHSGTVAGLIVWADKEMRRIKSEAAENEERLRDSITHCEGCNQVWSAEAGRLREDIAHAVRYRREAEAERDAARAEVDRHRMTTDERESALFAASMLASVNGYGVRIRGYLKRTKEGE